MGVLGINHIALRTPEPHRLRAFYGELLGAEELDGAHDPPRAGHTLIVFFASERAGRAESPDEIAFDVDARVSARSWSARSGWGCSRARLVEHTPWSKGFCVRDPDGRRLEFVLRRPERLLA